MKRPFYTIFVFARINTRRFFRDRLALFFGIAFPLIFLFIFGGLFGGNNSASFHIALVNHADNQFAKSFADQLHKNKAFNIDEKASSLDLATEKMSRGQLDATIELPSDFGKMKTAQAFPSGQAKVYYTQNNSQAGQTLTAVLQGIFKSVNTSL